MSSSELKNLIKQLSDTNPDTRVNAAYALAAYAYKESLTDRSALPKLVKLLEDTENVNVRWSAANALAAYAFRGFTDESALSKLVKLLEDRNENIRENAVYALAAYAEKGGLTDGSALPKLVKLLEDKNKNVYNNAVYALGWYAKKGGLTDGSVLPKLVKLLEDEYENVRWNAAMALGWYAEKGLTDGSALPKLVKLLEDTENVSNNAAIALGMYASKRLTDRSALPKLVKLLEDTENVNVRWNAVYALGEYAQNERTDGSALPKLVKLLEDRNENIRENAAWVLSWYAEWGFTDESALPKLVKLLEDRNENIRKKAEKTLSAYAKCYGVSREELIRASVTVADRAVKEDRATTLQEILDEIKNVGKKTDKVQVTVTGIEKEVRNVEDLIKIGKEQGKLPILMFLANEEADKKEKEGSFFSRLTGFLVKGIERMKNLVINELIVVPVCAHMGPHCKFKLSEPIKFREFTPFAQKLLGVAQIVLSFLPFLIQTFGPSAVISKIGKYIGSSEVKECLNLIGKEIGDKISEMKPATVKDLKDLLEDSKKRNILDYYFQNTREEWFKLYSILTEPEKDRILEQFRKSAPKFELCSMTHFICEICKEESPECPKPIGT